MALYDSGDYEADLRPLSLDPLGNRIILDEVYRFSGFKSFDFNSYILDPWSFYRIILRDSSF